MSIAGNITITASKPLVPFDIHKPRPTRPAPVRQYVGPKASGRRLEAQVEAILKRSFTMVERNVHRYMVEIDFIATNIGGHPLFIECKGGKRGLACSDAMRKAITNGWYLYTNHRIRLTLVTTRKPDKGSVADKLLDQALRHGIIRTAIEVDHLSQYVMTTAYLLPLKNPQTIIQP